MDLSKFLRQNHSKRSKQTRQKMSSYAAMVKIAKKMLKEKTPFMVYDRENLEYVEIDSKVEKDLIIEELFEVYHKTGKVKFIFSIYEPTSSKTNLKNSKNT